MEPRHLVPGDVVQISPELPDCFFGGCFMLVTEPKPWGAQGVVAMPQKRGEIPGEAYFRCEWPHMEYVGLASWVPKHGAEPRQLGEEG